MFRISIGVVSGFLASLAITSAASANPFSEKFDLVRDSNGVLKTVEIKSKHMNFDIQNHYQQFLADLQELKDVLRQRPKLENFTSEWPQERISNLEGAIRSEDVQGLEKTLATPEWKDFVNELHVGMTANLKEHLKGYRIVANPANPKFFYNRALSSKLINWMIKIAARHFGFGPGFGLAMNFVSYMIETIQLRRDFFQNYVIHYFLTNDASFFGLSHLEHQHVLSSVFESRINGWNFIESKIAQAGWDSYGNDKIIGLEKYADLVLEKNKSHYQTVGERLDYALQLVVEKGQAKVVGLIAPKFIFSPRPSDILFVNQPKKASGLRRLYRTARFAVHFVPMNGIVAEILDTFLKSLYASQMPLEGALLAAKDIATATGSSSLLGDSEFFEESFQGAFAP